MKYILDAESDVRYDEGILYISKGIWDYKEAVIECENKYTEAVAKQLCNKREIDFTEVKNEYAKKLIDYLYTNQYLEKVTILSDEKENSNDILLVISTDFEELGKKMAHMSIDSINIDVMYEKLGLKEDDKFDLLDALDLEIVYEKMKMNYGRYKEVAFLLRAPDVERMRVLAKALGEVEVISSYYILDNNLFFTFTCIPQETACFQCFNLRLLSRSHVLRRNNSKKRSLGYSIGNIQYYHRIEENVVYNLVFYLTIKQLNEDVQSLQRSNIGNLLVWNLNTLEFAKERLYRVPFCTGC